MGSGFNNNYVLGFSRADRKREGKAAQFSNRDTFWLRRESLKQSANLPNSQSVLDHSAHERCVPFYTPPVY